LEANAAAGSGDPGSVQFLWIPSGPGWFCSQNQQLVETRKTSVHITLVLYGNNKSCLIIFYKLFVTSCWRPTFISRFLKPLTEWTQLGSGSDVSVVLNDSDPVGDPVLCVPGYGQTGPQARSPGYDSIASAVSGMMHITGPEDGEPVRPGVAMTDLATGLYAHGAVMAALLHRQKTGRGSHIDCNLLSAQVSCLSHIAANYLNAGKEAKRWGTAHESIVPYQGFRTRDGHLVLAAANDRQFVTVCQVLELQDLAADPNYRTNQLRVQNRKQLLQILSQRFLQQNSADWLRRFQGSGVPVGPINSIQEVFSEPQVKHNGLIQEMEHPTAGRIAVPGPAVRFSSFPLSGPTPPPLIGQHTVQVLRDTLSYSDDVIKELLESRAVAQNEVS
uniref:Succinyl-CoA:glutarate-CoA transferase n=1 Tax=Xiphophorus couchianus TaxID=32473 RepID=A0A3B5L056_9TELE